MPRSGVDPAQPDGAGPWPLSSAEQRLWFLDQLEQGNPAYHVYRAVRMGAPCTPALGRALDEIVRRHEVLRTTFPAVDGCPGQVIQPESPVPLPVVDLAGSSPGRRQLELTARTLAESRRRFDLARGPLLARCCSGSAPRSTYSC